MSILDFLLNLIGKRPDNSPRTYELSEDLKVMLTRLAEREGRPEHEFTSDLVAAGLIQYLATDELKPKWKSLSAREKDVAKLISKWLLTFHSPLRPSTLMFRISCESLVWRARLSYVIFWG